VDWVNKGQGRDKWLFEGSNEHSGCIKCGEFPD
jgi:hypothetical protein